MKIEIEKLGKIDKADIDLDGLSVIAGKNDTGKSTVGKSIFALKKSISYYATEFNKIILKNITTRYEKIYPNLVGLVSPSRIIYETLFDLKDLSRNDKNISVINIKQILSKIENKTNSVKHNESNSSGLSIIHNGFDYINNLLDKDLISFEKLVVASEKIFTDVFKSSINNSLHSNDKASIKFSHYDKDIISMYFTDNKLYIDEKNTHEDLFDAGIKDVVLIDTPLIMENQTLSLKTRYHADLDKLLKNDSIIDDNHEILKKFNDIITGKFIRDTRTQSIFYKVSDEAKSLELQNVAMGTKIVGLLYLLIQNGGIDVNTLVILDEPENHLHPSWLVKFAEILCFMVKNGFKVLFTSHSPDFIQAINYYKKKYEIDKKTHFYLCDESKNNYINIRDVTNSLEEIFDNLTCDVNEMFLNYINEKFE